ncbi:hypothetical protein G7Y89_g20 [Cudoniella acicularis]|uniref:Uncharacterized protein n=1 Tax=Cudoniella acicularis TaxID=354080 RepID=A0A8H4RZH7_9HELO|nr:hypothetical protein G7Y89_g20 [Cudoniella acicularis]
MSVRNPSGKFKQSEGTYAIGDGVLVTYDSRKAPLKGVIKEGSQTSANGKEIKWVVKVDGKDPYLHPKENDKWTSEKYLQKQKFPEKAEKK